MPNEEKQKQGRAFIPQVSSCRAASEAAHLQLSVHWLQILFVIIVSKAAENMGRHVDVDHAQGTVPGMKLKQQYQSGAGKAQVRHCRREFAWGQVQLELHTKTLQELKKVSDC